MTYYENMKKALQESGDMEIGSFAADNIAAVAAEMERIRAMEIDRIPMRIFPTLAFGEDLTFKGVPVTIEQRVAQGAETDCSRNPETRPADDRRHGAYCLHGAERNRPYQTRCQG